MIQTILLITLLTTLCFAYRAIINSIYQFVLDVAYAAIYEPLARLIKEVTCLDYSSQLQYQHS